MSLVSIGKVQQFGHTMARLVCSVVILVCVLLCFLGGSGAVEEPGGSRISGIVSFLPQVNLLIDLLPYLFCIFLS